MVLFWSGLAVLCSAPVGLALILFLNYFYLRWMYVHLLVRIFQEKPLFVAPRGQPIPEAEDVRFPTSAGLTLAGCYLKAAAPRRGVILFGLEFASNRWSCLPYCEHLLAAGYDVFAFESRGQGDSDRPPAYDPLQWVTDFEVRDARAALAYLRARPDADPRGVGFFGISKGAGAGLIAAARDPFVRCCVTDGVFGSYTTMVTYIRHWFHIYSGKYLLYGLTPVWYYGLVGLAGLRRVARIRGCRFPHLEAALRRLRPRPLLMIQGGADTYIKPEMARVLIGYAAEPKELWVVPGAKHNQALHVAGDDYRRRVLEFFDRHLAQDGTPQPSPNRGDRRDERNGFSPPSLGPKPALRS